MHHEQNARWQVVYAFYFRRRHFTLSIDTKVLEWLLAELRMEFDDVKAEIGNDLSYLGMHIPLNKGKAVTIPERNSG